MLNRKYLATVLGLDEADIFLFSRNRAGRSWEISFTNEFLIRMERYRGILICTTNRMTDLDQASIRRFNHKIRFDYLTPEGNRIFYERLLRSLVKADLSGEDLRSLQGLSRLAPGDFKVVRDRFAFASGESITHQAMLTALREEAELIKVLGEKKGGSITGFLAKTDHRAGIWFVVRP